MGYALCWNLYTKEWNVKVQKRKVLRLRLFLNQKEFFCVAKETALMFAISLTQIVIKLSWVLFVYHCTFLDHPRQEDYEEFLLASKVQ